MLVAPVPTNEVARLRLLDELGILDTLEEEAYDDVTRLAAEICDTPIALVSLIDGDRQWFKSHHGLDARETPREHAFCAHAILQDDLFVVENARDDERFHDNPLVTDDPHVTFYAGAPLIMDKGLNVGTLCVIGHEEQRLTRSQARALRALARQVVSQLELRLKLKELEALDHAKDDFVSMVSHDLRTPLTSIYGSLSLLLCEDFEPLSDAQREVGRIAQRNTDRLLNLVNDILDFSKLEAGALDIELRELDLLGVLKEAVELNRPFCNACDVELSFDYPRQRSVVPVRGDAQRLLQVLANLISNAAKFSPARGEVQLDLSLDQRVATICVTDHGPGIAPEEQSELFQRFNQLSTSVNNKLPGSGLGLVIAKKLIELQNGVIGFKSTPNEATTFFFRLPLANSRQARPGVH